MSNKIIVVETGTQTISISEFPVTESELKELVRYLNWIRTATFGTYEAVKYKHSADYIDVAITTRSRNTLLLLNYEKDNENID